MWAYHWCSPAPAPRPGQTPPTPHSTATGDSWAREGRVYRLFVTGFELPWSLQLNLLPFLLQLVQHGFFCTEYVPPFHNFVLIIGFVLPFHLYVTANASQPCDWLNDSRDSTRLHGTPNAANTCKYLLCARYSTFVGLGWTTAAVSGGAIANIAFRRHTRGTNKAPLGFGPLLSTRYYIPALLRTHCTLFPVLSSSPGTRGGSSTVGHLQ